MRRLTVLLIAAAAAVLSAYDVVAYHAGGRATISEVLYDGARAYPVLAFAFGVLMGHLFWPQRTALPPRVVPLPERDQ